jgi:hypothetical protein
MKCTEVSKNEMNCKEPLQLSLKEILKLVNITENHTKIEFIGL